MMLTTSYIGNRGSRLNHHWQTYGVDANMNHPDVLALGTPVLQANINSDLARNAGITPPYPGFTGNVAQALRMYPQYQQIQWRGNPVGRSQYHAAEVVLERRFSRGLQARIAYTYSHLMNNGAEVGQGGDGRNAGIQNPADPLPWILSDDDTPHVAAERVHLGGSGPVTGRDEAGARRLERQWHPALRERPADDHHHDQRPRRVAVQYPEAAKPGRRAAWRTSATSIRSRIVTSTALAGPNPGPLQFGNAPERDGEVRGFPNFSEDINIFKVFPFSDQKRLRFELQIGNFFNRTIYCNPASNWSATDFGQVFTQCNTARSAQLGFRFDF